MTELKTLVKDNKIGKRLNSYFVAEGSGYRVYRSTIDNKYYLIDTYDVLSSFVIDDIEKFIKSYTSMMEKKMKVYDKCREEGNLESWLDDFFFMVERTSYLEALKETNRETNYNWSNNPKFIFIDEEGKQLVH